MPGVDASFIVLLILAINEIRDNRKKAERPPMDM
jgi:hypothetical protein